ncbi:MAG: dockerin type I domain-containing protein [Dehalococcoidia bacterium]
MMRTTNHWSMVKSAILLTIASIAMLTLLVGGVVVKHSEAAGGTPSPDLSIGIDVDGDTVPDCNTQTSPPADSCIVPPGAQFTIRANVNSLAGMPDGDSDTTAGYLAVAIKLEYSSGLTRINRPAASEIQGIWPGCTFDAEADGPGSYLIACVLGLGANESTYLGRVAEIDFACTTGETSGNTISLVHGDPEGSELENENLERALDQNDKGVDEVLTIDCSFPWDINGDGVVSVADIVAVVMAFGQTVPPASADVDVNADGVISVADVVGVVQHFGQMAP